MVTKTSFRYLNTLFNLGAAPEPNLTVLWSTRLPRRFKEFAREGLGGDERGAVRERRRDARGLRRRLRHRVLCLGDASRQADAVLRSAGEPRQGPHYAINGGRDEISGKQVSPKTEPVGGDVLEYDDVMAKYDAMLDWLAAVYVGALNIIHFMHDKYSYERLEMALHDRDVQRMMAFGIAGLSVAADSLSAIKYAKVRPIRDDTGLVVDYEIEGEFPTFGNADERVDSIANGLVRDFMAKIRTHPTYRHSIASQSILTITSNVVYGKLTGATPDGRKAGQPFAPGANPMSGRDVSGPVASMCSVAGLPYEYAQDGISYTFSIVPPSLGHSEEERADKLVGMLDGYFSQGGHHINVNVLDRAMLLDAIDHPERYPMLTVRVSGYAVKFSRLTREQQLDVVNRTFHGLTETEKVAVVGACVE